LTAEEAGKAMILQERDAFAAWYTNKKLSEELKLKNKN